VLLGGFHREVATNRLNLAILNQQVTDVIIHGGDDASAFNQPGHWFRISRRK
jgi:hypothetical protein